MIPLKRIALLGCTGSIGVQTLDVVRAYPSLFQVEVLVARRSADLLIKQAMEFQPNAVVLTQEDAYLKVKQALANQPIKVYCGVSSMLQVIQWDSVDLVLNALVGFAGLEPTLTALAAGKPVALANKESLVAGGELVIRTALEHKAPLLPVDSEHSAIFQCLQGESPNRIEKILLTASGGPFFGRSREQMEGITKEMALNHPTWTMGSKVTIDSASLMNKGLEVIEAKWLFGVEMSQIEVLVHPQSLVHSMVQFEDGSVKAQLSCPDMRLPILYALSYPKRLSYPIERMDFSKSASLQFYQPDNQAFPCLSLAYLAMEKGGNIPCTLNAANEVAVAAFLEDRISFTQIPVLIAKTMEKVSFVANPSFEAIRQTHDEALSLAHILLKSN